ncbi:MAG: hypothetical protein CMJ19_03570 [Phycisphaeraceae bacterium]|nr:hypothetical protein [Phycisphaeraceae bacterium]
MKYASTYNQTISYKRQRGVAMVLVLIALAMATVIGLSFLNTQSTTTGIAQNASKQTRARGIAESALEMTIDYLRTNNDWRNEKADGVWVAVDDANSSLDGGKFSVIVQDGTIDESGNIVGDGDLANNLTDKIVITAVGYFDGVAHSIRAQVTPASSGPQHSMLYVTDGANPTAGESARINLLKSFGYTINTIASSASSAQFTSQMANNDVIYISSLVDGIANKVVNSGVGIVTEQTDTYNTLGFSSNSHSYTGSEIKITNTSHNITASMSSGETAITMSDQTLIKLSGTVSQGVVGLADHPYWNYRVLAVLPKGAVTVSGNTTSGRRVKLPWGTSNFDFASLNATGKALLEAAVNWAAASPSEGGGPWTGLDIGYNSPAGSNTFESGVFTIHGAGDDIWNNDDEFRFVHMPVTGNGELIARVTSVENTNGWAKAGVMIRESLDDDSRHVMVVVTPSSGVAYQRRTSTGGSSDHTYNSGSAPYWVKIVRNDNEIRGYLSTSGNDGTWNSAGDAITLSGLPETVYFGLCLTSHNSNALCTATFDNVTLNGEAVEEEEDDAVSPQLIVQYEFNEVAPPTPVLLHNWKLDETTGSSGNSAILGTGASAGNKVYMDDGKIDSYNSAEGEYNSTKSSSAVVTVNSTSSDRIYMDWGTRIYGDVHVGKNGNPSHVIHTPDWSYEPHISGIRTSQDENVTLPNDIEEPSGMPSKSGSYTQSHWQPKTINSNMNVGDFTVTSGALLYVSGDITVLCDKFTVSGNAEIIIPQGSSLTVYARDRVEISGSGKVNAKEGNSYSTRQTDRFKLYAIDDDDVTVSGGQSIVVGYLYSTDDVILTGSGQVYGGVGAEDEIRMYGSESFLHVDQNLAAGGSSSAGASNVVVDEQNASDGQYHGGPTGPHDGQVGTSVYFDGTNDYAEIPHNDNMLLNSGTVAMWINTAKTGCGEQAFFSKDSTNYDTGGHLTMWVWGNKISVRLQSTNDSYWVDSSSISANTWYHVAFSWGSNGMKLFINGQLVDTNSYTGGIGSNSGGSGNYEPIVLGASSWDSNNLSATPLCDYFKGYIDDVRMYDLDFEESQATQLYNGSDPGAGTTGYLVEDTSNFGNPLNLSIQNTNNVNWIEGGGLEFESATSAVSDSGADKIYSALTATNKMTLEVKFKTNSIDQTGPANIVSFSNDAYARNFTFAQSQQEYLMRLRTSTTSDNGSESINSSDVLDTENVQHVVMTYDGQHIKLYRNGSTTPEVTAAREGTFDWNNAYRLILGNEEGGSNPWLGKLYRFTIYDQALNSLQVKDIFDGNPPGDYEEQENLTFHVRWYENP